MTPLSDERAALLELNPNSMTLPTFFADQSELMRTAAAAAQVAGEVIRVGYDQAHKIESKGIGDLVSQVDFDADKRATEVLQEHSPDLPIMSEELSPETDDPQQKMWVVDPLDGTTAYLMRAGRQYSSVLISLCEGGHPTLGVTYFPLTNEWFYAEKGCGSFKDGRRFTLTPQEYRLSAAWIEMNQYGDSRFESDFFSAARRALRAPGGARIATSSFPHAGVAMRIAEQNSGLVGAMHDNCLESLKQGPWDIAANQAIFEEAGGHFLNAQLERVSPFVAEPFLVVPCLSLAEQIIECVSAHVA
ncbi:MAG TPA: hypothetical protein DDW52_19605 [Planctomycetaceae bacterium]|nr:hypothetical protein [Planctomycetaceae bacterium]